MSAARALHSSRKPAPRRRSDEAPAEAPATAELGMWVFLSTETLFFGALFFGYTVARLRYPHAFASASRDTDLLLGSLNTAVLLSSSVAMALGVTAARTQLRRAAIVSLAVTAVLGVIFIAIKCVEYRQEYLHHLLPGAGFVFDAAEKNGAELFFWLYFVMTGFHAVHLLIGIGLVGFAAVRLHLRGFAAQSPTSVEMTGLYWHFVDLIWIFLFPCIYLVARS